MKKVASQQQSPLEFLTNAFHETVPLILIPITTLIDKIVKLSEFLIEKTNIAKYITIFLFVIFLIATILYFYRP